MIYGIDITVLIVIIIMSILTVSIGSYPSLIAGYQSGDLPEEDEEQLVTDIRIVLIGVTLSLFPLLIQNRIDLVSVSVATGLSLAVSLILVGWIVWKYNVT
jgi:hypothetical protein